MFYEQRGVWTRTWATVCWLTVRDDRDHTCLMSRVGSGMVAMAGTDQRDHT